MAKISLIVGCSHSPFLYTPPDQWNEIRSRRSLRDDVPLDSPEENVAKFQRCMQGFQVLREKVEQAKPDVLLIFGDDQGELFHFDNFPAFGVYVGEDFEGHKTVGRPVLQRADAVGGGHIGREDVDADMWAHVKGCAPLGRELMEGLMEREFDPAFSTVLPDTERGMGHAFLRPEYYITPEYNIPVLPVFVNCYYAPQPRAERCFDLGRAVRDVIEHSPLDLNVAIMGSGGLWHTPGGKNAYLDEEFDHRILDAMEAGDGREAARYFDAQARPGQVGDGADARGMDGGTNTRGGVGSGTGEWRNWMAAAGVAEGRRAHVIDFVPVYASPCAMGFAFWE
ncbi:MAG TPA: hypothetical protein VGK54_16505 [Chloroflexota bacterium]